MSHLLYFISKKLGIYSLRLNLKSFAHSGTIFIDFKGSQIKLQGP